MSKCPLCHAEVERLHGFTELPFLGKEFYLAIQAEDNAGEHFSLENACLDCVKYQMRMVEGLDKYLSSMRALAARSERKS